MSFAEALEEVKKRDMHPNQKPMKEFAIHIPEQIVYTTAHDLKEAEEIARDEYASLHDSVTERINGGK